MHPIRFSAVRSHGIHVFHHLPGGDVTVSRHWPGLFEEWPEGKTPFSEWAVNNNNMEEVAVYVGLVWRLTAGLARYAIPAYYRDDVARKLGREPVLVDWEYEVDAGRLTAESRDRGFVPGRSAVAVRPRPTAREVENAGRAGLFPLATPRDLVSVLHAVIFDASSEITVFAVPPGAGRLERLTAALRGPVRPTLGDVLGDDGIFLDLTIGSDLGNYDSVVVASRSDLLSPLTDLAADCARRVESYEQRLDELRGVSDFLRAMPELAGVDLDAS
ncbi:hypothetical protein CW362_24235 [Streptomyces populi]|uniref:Uncharacterized protein n=1 Tax=Streptomyces populi TaxID=2058924 RepID=A0A2I0SKJ6_9ACTN|nr:hypothetical protein [Streptomyces populi]PKT70468.1 hypothetical protein CW362_24235 [Streptomyces populi]